MDVNININDKIPPIKVVYDKPHTKQFMVDGKLYEVLYNWNYCKDINFHDVYIGHTTNFVQRKHAHKRACNKSTEQSHNLKVYKIIREHGGWDNWNMEMIGFKNCKDHSEACTVEQEYFDSYEASLNSILAKKSIIERLPIAKEKLDLYCEVCKIKCSCTKSFERHKKTKKHLSLAKAQENAEISTSKDKSEMES